VSQSSRTGQMEEVNRRHFLKATAGLAAAVVSGLTAETAEARPRANAKDRPRLIDTNVTLSHWPFRRLPLDQTAALVAKLRSHGVVEAWAGSFDGLLHKDLGAVNAQLVEECRRHGRGMLRPFGSVNPTLPDWEEELRRCHEQYEMAGIRLHPNYHGYRLDDKRFAQLLDAAGERGLVVQLSVLMEDERTQHPLMRVPHVDVAPLFSLLDGRPKVRLELLNWSRGVKPALVSRLANDGQVFFEIASVEGVNGVADLLKQVPRERVLFGSDAPFFYFESAWLKLQESELTGGQSTAIREGNARQLVA
jgi:uncharacterized protein